MLVTVRRFKSDNKGTIGTLHVDGEPYCFTLEDAHHDKKIPKLTRIPIGHYQIKLRDEGSMTHRYREKYALHRGMLWLQDVPNFEWVYIHTGNTDEDTDGCILVGEIANLNENQKVVGESRDAYEKIYAILSGAILNGIKVTIQIIDE